MSFIRRILGILVMIAGILGLVLGLAGLVGVWMAKPGISNAIDTTVTTLNTSIGTSQEAMDIAGDTLSAAVDSVDALSEMLANTAVTVQDTQPVFTQLNTVISDTLPATFDSAVQSLNTAQQAAGVLDDTIKSLDTFRMVLSATPLLGAMVQTGEPYNPEVPLADSLGSLAEELDGLPDTFTQMADDIDKADDNLVTIQGNLITMSESIGLISQSLSDYQTMVARSKTSMDNLKALLTSVQTNQDRIINGTTIVLTLLLLWLLAAQIVILSQGWELYHGTAGRMDNGRAETVVVEKSETPDEV